MHAAGTSLAGIPANAEGYGGLLHEVVEVAWDDADALQETIDGLGAGRVAAFFCEPVLGAGGVYPPPAGLPRGRARTSAGDAGVLFIADEVITGFGRCGEWFASERFGLEPDLDHVREGDHERVPAARRGARRAHACGSRSGAREPGCSVTATRTAGTRRCRAAALANLDIIEREGLLDRAAELEGTLADTLGPLAEHAWSARCAAGTGCSRAVQIDPARSAADPALLGRLVPSVPQARHHEPGARRRARSRSPRRWC